MEVDWEVEIGGGAPVIEAEWSGFVDLRTHPERIAEIAEAVAFPPLAALLLALNAPGSPVWTSKCDVWEPEPASIAAYIDILPREGKVFPHWHQAEAFCREYAARLVKTVSPRLSQGCSIELVIRQAVAGEADGFGISAYLSASASCRPDAGAAMTSEMAAFADALPPATSCSKLQ